MEKYKTIEISKETYDRLCVTKKALSKILHKNVSFDLLFKLFFTVQPLELVLQDMILEENPSVGFKKKPKKQKESDESDEP